MTPGTGLRPRARALPRADPSGRARLTFPAPPRAQAPPEPRCRPPASTRSALGPRPGSARCSGQNPKCPDGLGGEGTFLREFSPGMHYTPLGRRSPVAPTGSGRRQVTSPGSRARKRPGAPRAPVPRRARAALALPPNPLGEWGELKRRTTCLQDWGKGLHFVYKNVPRPRLSPPTPKGLLRVASEAGRPGRAQGRGAGRAFADPDHPFNFIAFL